MSEPIKLNPRLEDRIRLLLKAEIKRANLTYEEVAARLQEHGFNENAASITNKLMRGTFSATFFIAVLKVTDKDIFSSKEV